MPGESVSVSWPLVCVTSSALEPLLQLQEQATLIEWRADLLGEKPPKSIEPARILWTWRLHGQEGQMRSLRLGALLKALHKYAYVDMQLEEDEALLKSLRPKLAQRVMLSYHAPFETLQALQAIVARMRQFPHVGSWKIALDFSNQASTQIASCLEWLKTVPELFRSKIIFVPMGERFASWRLLAAHQLNPFLFCSAQVAAATAKGQLPYEAVKLLQRQNPPEHLYGLLGHPVRQSISHLSHNRLLQSLGLSKAYLKFDLLESELEEMLAKAPSHGLVGFSVTVPYKEKAFKLAQHVSPQAQAALAANTLIWRQDHWYADNTDVKAFRDIYHRLNLGASARVLILGAGGSSRAALAALSSLGSKIYLHNRTKERSEVLGREFELELIDALAITPAFLEGIDLLIQTTSLGMSGAQEHSNYPFDFDSLNPKTAILELVNAASAHHSDVQNFAPTPLARYALEKGHPLVSAEEFFFRQAAYQFESWLGVHAKEFLAGWGLV